MVDPSVSTAWAQFEVQAITIIGPVLITGAIGILGALAVFVKQKLNADARLHASNAIENAIDNGANQGVVDAADHIASGGTIANIRDYVSVAAEQYALPKIGAEMKTLGISPESLPDRIDARVSGKLLDPIVVAHLADAVQARGLVVTGKPAAGS